MTAEIRDAADNLLDRLLFQLVKRRIDVTEIKSQFYAVLADYQISEKEEALTIYTGKNEKYIQHFILSKAIAGCTPRTLERYKYDVTRALQAIGKDADTITHTDIQIYLGQLLARGISKRGANNNRLAMSSFFAWMAREGHITTNPILRVEKIRYHPKKKTAFSEEELELIRANCMDERESALVEVMYSTGCRVSEIRGMKINQIRPDGSIEVLGKGQKYRNAYMSAKCKIAVQRYIACRKDSNPYLFPSSSCAQGVTGSLKSKMNSAKSNWWRDPELVSQQGAQGIDALRAIVAKIGKRAGVENVHPHRFRHTCATHALKRGMPIEQVSLMLGHTSIETTQIYLDISEDDMSRNHQRFVI